MSGKDLLAVLVMIVPSFLLIALIAFALVPSAQVATAPSAAGFVHGSAGTQKVHEGHDASMHTKPRTATQKRMRDPWERPQDAKTAQPMATARCNSSVIDDDRSCL